jgi:hypothetical protein
MVHNPCVHFIHPRVHVPHLLEQLLIDSGLLLVDGGLVSHGAITVCGAVGLCTTVHLALYIFLSPGALYIFIAERRKHVNKKH